MASWIPERAPGDTEFAQVFGLRDNLYRHYSDLAARLWQPGVLDPVVLELCRLRAASLLGSTGDAAVRSRPAVAAGLTEDLVTALPNWPSDPRMEAPTRACIAFAELFVMDPSQISAPGSDVAAAVTAEVGTAGLVGLVNAMALFDGFPRFRMILGIGPDAAPGSVVDVGEPDPSAPPAPDPADADPSDAVASSPLARQPELLASFQRLYGVLWSHGVVDHPSKEVARLRNARVTGCRYCRNVRFEQARLDGLTENLVDMITDRYETSTLSKRHKVVLRLADAFLLSPSAGLPEPVRTDLLAAYGSAGAVELTAGLALFLGFSKIAVSLGATPDDFPTMVIPTPDLVPVG
jgi:alkylhydroperoxidase family enzyme